MTQKDLTAKEPAARKSAARQAAAKEVEKPSGGETRGRRRKGGAAFAKRTSVTLVQETYDFLVKEGDGVASEGIERVVAEVQATRQKRRVQAPSK
ncbi:MAG: hypothetical protein ACOZE7_04335 [Pseudomonadota bacterium]